MLKFALVVSLVVLFCAGRAQGQEEGGGGEGGLWTKLKESVKKFVASLKSLFDELKTEVEARTSEMRSWTKEMMDSFKIKMKEWVNQAKGSESEKDEMVDYIEKLQLPNDI